MLFVELTDLSWIILNNQVTNESIQVRLELKMTIVTKYRFWISYESKHNTGEPPMFSAMLNNIQDVRRFKARQKYARANQIEENVRSESLAFIKFFFKVVRFLDKYLKCPVLRELVKLSP